MTRSTPSSSGSGNMTPASMRMAVSPQAISIMFMPNSPSPPSGMISRGGTSAPTFWSSFGNTSSQLATPWSKDTSTADGHPGEWVRARRGGGPRIHGVHRSSAGTEDQLIRLRASRFGGIGPPALTLSGPKYSTAVGSARNENVRKPRQFIELQRLGSPGGVDAGAGQRRDRAHLQGLREWLQRIRQGLASLHEHRPDHRFEPGVVCDPNNWRPESQPDDTGVDLRRRPEGTRRQRQQAADVGVELHEDRENTEVLRAWLRLDPFRDLSLKHQGRVNQSSRGLVRVQQTEKDR